MRTSSRWLFLAVLAGLCPHLASAAGPSLEANAPETVTVAPDASFNGDGFTYQLRLLRKQAQHHVYAVQFPSPVDTGGGPNDTVPGEYYLPANLSAQDAPRPAVICLHILNGDFELVRLLCALLSERGVPAMMFKLPYYGERGGKLGRRQLLSDAGLFMKALDQSIFDSRRAVDLLASRPEVDAEQIGISGISLGAIIAGTVCGSEPRLHRALLALGGGDLPAILGHSRETRQMRAFMDGLAADQRLKIEQVMHRMDPLTHAAALQRLAKDGRLAMINAAEDEVIPRACTERLAKAAGMSDRVTWLEGVGHYTAMAVLPRILRDTRQFFAQDLPDGVVPPPEPPANARPPLHTFAALCMQIATLVQAPAETGHGHYGSLKIEVREGDNTPSTYHLSVVRGNNDYFRLEAHPFPEVKQLFLGNGDYPWFVGRDGMVFAGKLEPAAGKPLGSILAPEALAPLQMANAMAVALAMAPDAFSEYFDVKESTEADGVTGRLDITFSQRHKVRGTGTFRFQRNPLTPLQVTFSHKGTAGSVDFTQWAINTVARPELFQAPEAGKIREVPAADVRRMFAAVFGFVMEAIQ